MVAKPRPKLLRVPEFCGSEVNDPTPVGPLVSAKLSLASSNPLVIPPALAENSPMRVETEKVESVCACKQGSLKRAGILQDEIAAAGGSLVGSRGFVDHQTIVCGSRSCLAGSENDCKVNGGRNAIGRQIQGQCSPAIGVDGVRRRIVEEDRAAYCAIGVYVFHSPGDMPHAIREETSDTC